MIATITNKKPTTKTLTIAETIIKGILKSTLVLGMALQIACQSKNSDEKLNVKGSKVVQANASMSSTELTDAAEQLLTPTQFMHADRIIELALEKDENNIKAQFYRSFLKGIMHSKGILTRIKPLVREYGDITQYENSVNSLPDLHLKKFLTDGEEDIKSVKEIQNWLTEYQLALNDFRKFLIVHQDETFNVELNAQALEASLKDPDSYSCETVSENNDNYTVKCDYTQIGKKQLSAPDLIALRQFTAGTILYLNIYTAYSYEGIEIFKSVTAREDLKPWEIEKFIQEKMPQFGKLRANNLLKETLPMGSDFINASRWVIQYQNKMCPQGKPRAQQRKSALFHEGLCVENANEALSSLALLEQMLTETMKVKFPETNNELLVNHTAWFKNPVQDLLSLTPKEYDQCGNIKSLKDPSMGGIFVNNDAEKLIVATKVCK